MAPIAASANVEAVILDAHHSTMDGGVLGGRTLPVPLTPRDTSALP